MGEADDESERDDYETAAQEEDDLVDNLREAERNKQALLIQQQSTDKSPKQSIDQSNKLYGGVQTAEHTYTEHSMSQHKKNVSGSNMILTDKQEIIAMQRESKGSDKQLSQSQHISKSSSTADENILTAEFL